MPLVNSKKQDKSRLCRLQFAEKRQTQDLWQRNFMQIAKFMRVYCRRNPRLRRYIPVTFYWPGEIYTGNKA
jgi:hypothetical protein